MTRTAVGYNEETYADFVRSRAAGGDCTFETILYTCFGVTGTIGRKEKVARHLQYQREATL
jgi:hypothetical protein